MIFILTGEVNSGKTTLLAKWVEKYLSEGRYVGGVLAPANWDGGKKVSYDVLDIGSGTRRLLASTKPLPDAEQFGRFWFSKGGLSFAESALERLNGDFEVGIIDEIGPLELAGGGLAKGISAVLRHPPEKLVLVVRNSLVSQVVRKFRIGNYQILTTTSPRP